MLINILIRWLVSAKQTLLFLIGFVSIHNYFLTHTKPFVLVHNYFVRLQNLASNRLYMPTNL